MVACEECDLGRVVSLLPGQDVNAKNEGGSSALTLAVKAGEREISRVLLENGAEVDCLNKAKQSPLFVACWNGDVEMVAMLLEAGADTNVPDTRGWTPLMAAVYNDSLPIAQLLLRYGCQTSSLDTVTFTQFGKSAFDRAKSPQMTELLQKFVSEHRTVPASENVRRVSDRPEIAGFPKGEKQFSTPSKTVSGRSSSAPEFVDKSFANIPASVSPEGKRKIFREALEQEVRKNAAFVAKKLEDEYVASLHTGLKQQLSEIDKSLREDLQESLRLSKVAMRTSLKTFVGTLVRERLASQRGLTSEGEGRSEHKLESLASTKHDINARDDCPLPYFPASHLANRRTKEDYRPQSFSGSRSQKTKVSAALQRFLEGS